MCDFISCKKPSNNFYKLGELKFSYCDNHKRIPEMIIYKIENGFYMPFRYRMKNAMPTGI